ncbi:MAG: PIN domain-containing protein [Deltaproteobacteria bacterium]|nr:PIN domain-containing protein [Deltaproteobacteria bacterium]
MKIAYVDSSCLVSIAFSEPGSAALRRRLRGFDRLLSSGLLEAELRAVLAREGVETDPKALLASLWWVHPDRPLSEEIDRVLACGSVRGADLWHLACALLLAADPAEIAFLTLDRRQAEIARHLGFAR